MLNQKLKLSLSLNLSPKQIQLMKLLQLPTFALDQRIKDELEVNPALEEGEEDEQGDDLEENNDLDNDNNDNDDDDEFSLSDYVDEDDIPDYKLYANNRSKDDEDRSIPIASSIDFHDYLLSQIGDGELNEKQTIIAKQIIGNIDDSGYLTRDISALSDDLVFLQNVDASEEEILEVLTVIHDFDPCGVGARDLKECLIIQLKRKEDSTKSTKLAIEILDKMFDDFSRKHYNKIIHEFKISETELKEVIAIILKLNPKPGSSFSDNRKFPEYVIPDFTVNVNDGELELILNSKNAPDLRTNRKYIEMLQAYSLNKNKKNKSQKDTVMFVKQKLDSARWFIDAVKQRQLTLISIMNEIMKQQKEFFLTGDESKMKPLILRDIATEVKLDVSTVSRATSNKYVQTPYGTLSLRTFFPYSFHTEEGDVSMSEIKSIFKELIDNEDKRNPLTDTEIAAILKTKGFDFARRTVGKYREQLGIRVASQRKEL